MIVIKTIILSAIFGGSALIGIMVSNKYRNRTIQLCEMKKALNFFEAKIEYTYEPLADIFIEISNNIRREIGSIFKVAAVKMRELSAKEAWEYSVNIAQTSLKEEDLDIIRDFGKILGQTDLQGQLNKVKLTLGFLETQITQSQIEENKNKKLYKTLGVLTGAGLVIILI